MRDRRAAVVHAAHQDIVRPTTPPSAERLAAVDDAPRTRPQAATRQLAGAAAWATVLVVVPLAGLPFGPAAWAALALAVVLFGASHHPAVVRLFDEFGGIVASTLVTLLAIGTGGPDSPFLDMYAIVLVYSAIVMGWRRLAFDVAVVAAGATAVGLVGAGGVPYYADLLVDLAVWVTIALIAGGISQRLVAVTQRQRADAALVAAADTALITTDASGDVRSWNPAASRLYGIRQEDAVGRHIGRVVASPDDDPSRGTTGRLERVQYGTRHHHRDGSPIDVEVTAWPVPTADGGTAMGMMVRDISSHRATELQLRLQQERFRVFAEQARGVVYRYEVGPPPRLSYLSPRMADLLGLDPRTVQADPATVLSRIHPDDGVPFDPPAGTGRFDEGVHVYRVQHADGSWVWVEDHHQPEFDDEGRTIASQGILYDVSARKQLEQAREQALADAQETARQLERTTLAQTVFLRSVSHQLRTPMTLVRGFATTLRRRGDDLDADVRDMLVERLLSGVERLDEHLSDLLEMQAADAEAGLRHGELVDLGELCFAAVATVDTDQHHVAVATTRGEVVGDRRQLGRAVAALVRNATQHTPAGTRITVEMHRDCETVGVRVRDEGPGVDEEIRARIFEPFVQGRAAATTHAPGAGIGLTFVRQVALRHGGTVTCTPLAPTGTQFDLVLPLAEDAAHVSA